MPESPTIAEAVEAFKEYVEALKQRPDVLVNKHSYIGPPADAEMIKRFREEPNHRGNAGRMPAELLDLCELMNGAEVRWQFRQQPAEANEEWRYGADGGAIELRRLSEESRFEPDNMNERTFFGPEAIALLFDEPEMEYGIWLAAYGPGGPEKLSPWGYEPNTTEEEEEYILENADTANVQLVYAYEDVNKPLRMTIAEYLLQAIAHDLAFNWQDKVADEVGEQGESEEEEEEESE